MRYKDQLSLWSLLKSIGCRYIVLRYRRFILRLNAADLQIMISLADTERHGYGIMREIEERSNGEVRLGPGTLYTAIKRMLLKGWIIEAARRPDPAIDDSRRRYYSLSPLGRATVVEEAERLESLLQAVRNKGLLKVST